MRQHDHHLEGDDDDEAQGITNNITDLAESALEDRDTITSVLVTIPTTIKVLQNKIETMKKGTSQKKTITIKVIV